MKPCGLKRLLLQELRAGGYGNKGLLSIGASDALIKPDRPQDAEQRAPRSHPGLGGWAGRQQVPQPRPQAVDPSLCSPSPPFTTLRANHLASTPSALCLCHRRPGV